MEFSVVGKSVPRVDALEEATGQAIFGTDIKLPRMLYAKVLRSPYPHAKIVSIDTIKAEQLPGVVCVITGKDADLIAQHIVGNITLTPDQLSRADVNGDGKITILDAYYIEQYVVGQIDTFPVCPASPGVSPAIIIGPITWA